VRQVRIGIPDALDDRDMTSLVARRELGEVRVESDAVVERDRVLHRERRSQCSIRRIRERHDGRQTVVATTELDHDERAVVAPAERRRGGARGAPRRGATVGPHRQPVSGGHRRTGRDADPGDEPPPREAGFVVARVVTHVRPLSVLRTGRLRRRSLLAGIPGSRRSLM
jgi:hypothetical protein